MKSISTFGGPATTLALTAIAALAATAALAQAPQSTSAGPSMMLTMPQAVAVAEAMQVGAAYSVRREAAGGDVVYHVKLSTADRGIVEVHVAAFGGRITPQPHDRD